MSAQTKPDSPGRVITFYSYKGGTGRSMALANVAALLAQQSAQSDGRGVLMVDWDLEAPGLHKYFQDRFTKRLGRSDDAEQKLDSYPGLIDYFLELAERVNRPEFADEESVEKILRSSLAKLIEGAQSDFASLVQDLVVSGWDEETAAGDDPARAWKGLLLNRQDEIVGSLMRHHARGDTPGLERFIQEELARALLGEIDIEGFTLPTDVDSLSLLKAGSFDDNYASRVNTFDWEGLYAKSPLLFRAFAGMLAEKYSYVLIDSRTGETDISGICTMIMPETLVIVFTPNRQSLTGALRFTRRVVAYRRQSDDLRQLTVFPLPSRIELSEDVLRDEWRSDEHFGYEPAFERVFEEVYALKKCKLGDYFNDVMIRHASSYSYGEKIAVLSGERADRNSLTTAYQTFARTLTTKSVPWEEPKVDEAHAVGEKFVQRAEQAYAQLSAEEQPAARQLFTRLVRLAPYDDGSQDTLAVAALDDLSTAQQALAKCFADAGVLVMAKDKSGRLTVKPAHESIVRDWRRLRGWVDSNREFLLWRLDMQAGMAKWQENGQQEKYLLGEVLFYEAPGWMMKQPEGEFTAAELTYLMRSAEVIGRRRNRRIKLWAAALALALVGLAVGGIWAYNARRSAVAEQERRTQKARELLAAAESLAGTATDLQLPVLLALESLNSAETPQAVSFLNEKLPMLGRRVKTLKHDGAVDKVYYADSASSVGTVSSRLIAGANVADNRKPGDMSQVERVVYSWDQSGNRAGSYTFERQVRLFDMSRSRGQVAWVGGDAGSIVYMVSLNNTELVQLVWPKVVSPNPSRPISNIRFNPDNTLLGITGRGGAVALVAAAGDVSSLPRGPAVRSEPLEALAFSADGAWVAAVGDAPVAEVWHVGQPNEPQKLLKTGMPAYDVVLSQTGKYVAVVFLNEGMISVYRVADGKNVADIKLNDNWSLAFIMGEDAVAYVRADGGLGIMNLPDAKEIQLAAAGRVSRVVSSDDGSLFATLDGSNVVRVWRASDFSEVARLVHANAVNDFTFGTTNDSAATASADTTASVWNWGPVGQDLPAEACARLSRNLTPQEWSQHVSSQESRRLTCPSLP